MAFKKPSIKKTVVDIGQSRIYLRSVKKFGKTTLFKDIILEKYGDPECGLLLGIGNETGYDYIRPLNTSQVETWEDLLEFKEWILSDDESAKKIQMIAFDTIDELVPIIEDYVCRLSEEKTKKVCSSINEAFGGFQRGQDKACELLKEFFADLYKAGKGLFAIAHTKLKTIRDKGSETTEGYQQLTSNLSSKYESVFGDIFDFVLTGCIDREIVDGVATGEVRKLYFRGTTIVDAGGRFKHGTVPEYIVFGGDESAKEVIETIETGMRESAGIKSEDLEKYKEQSNKEREKLHKESLESINEKAKYEEYAREHIAEYAMKAYTNKDFKEKLEKIIAEKNVKKVQELNIEDRIELIKFGVEELNIEME